MACGPETPAPEHSDPAKAPPSIAEPDSANHPAGIEWVRKRYARITKMEEYGLVRCDSLAYTCDSEPINGLFTFCYIGEDLVRATHSRSIADHSYTSEEYYLDIDDLYFVHLREGNWQFAQPPGAKEGEVISHTRDDVREERVYYEEGNLIERLFKDYQLLSWDDRGPEDFPNSRQGEPIRDVLGLEAVLAQRGKANYSCPE